MTPITHYIEERHEFGELDHGTPKPGVMEVYYEDGVPVMVDFLCPCGCGRTCPTHLVPPGHPHKDRRWAYSLGSQGPTLTPSIRWTGGCKAHFNVTDGRVIVHRDSGK